MRIYSTMDRDNDKNPFLHAQDRNRDLQTKMRGKLAEEYEIYRTTAEQLGRHVKTFDEWLGM